MIDIISLKIIAIVLIFLVGLAGGILPALAKKHSTVNWLLYQGDFLARGIFLGAGLLHLLPEAMHEFAEIYPDIHYPVIMTICALTIFVVLFIEKGTIKQFSRLQINAKSVTAHLLMVLLSIHSVIEGLALGFGETFASVIILLIAIMVHKSSAAFALSIKLRKADISHSAMIKIVSLFALMTPIGIALGSIMLANISGTAGHVVECIFNAIAAGTFIYIGLLDTDDHQASDIGTERQLFTKIIYLGLGISLMGIVAIWI